MGLEICSADVVYFPRRSKSAHPFYARISIAQAPLARQQTRTSRHGCGDRVLLL